MKQVIYFFEGETERKILKFLKDNGKIRPGKLKKFNLWTEEFKLIRTINKADAIFFVIDTDTNEKDIFIKNLKLLKPYNVCLIVQNKDLEDEVCFACGESKKTKLFNNFYNVKSESKFKKRFIADKNIGKKLGDNNFVFDKLWSRGDNFANLFKVNINCNYRVKLSQKNQ